jgi:hypothetical protein
MILSLHRRLYHKPAEQLRTILSKAGVPIRCLALVRDAVELCEVCLRWKRPGNTPMVKTSLAGQFNEMVYADLVFSGDWVFLLVVDDCIRFMHIPVCDFKSFQGIEKCLGRGWLAHFGTPARIRTDKERALAHETFGSYCEKLGIKRELVTAKDDHARLGVIDRRVQMFRHMLNTLHDMLASDGCKVEPEDLASESMIAIDTMLSYCGSSPYQCLYGALPNDILDLELDTVSSFEEAHQPCYEHQLIRTRARQAFHQALLQVG